MQDNKRSIGLIIGKIIKNIVVYLIAIFIVGAAILFATSKSPNKSFFGYRYYTVLTPSMEPELSVGDLIFVKLKNASDIQIGDVITFNPSSDPNVYLTHRVTQKMEDYEGTGVTCFKTKGDANQDEDDFVIDSSRVIGTQQFKLAKLGYFVRFVQLRWYYFIPLFIMVIIFIKLLDTYFDMKEEDEEASEETPADGEESKGAKADEQADNSQTEDVRPEDGLAASVDEPVEKSAEETKEEEIKTSESES